MPSLEDRVLDKGRSRLLDLRHSKIRLWQHPDRQPIEHRLDLAHLAGVVARQHHPLGNFHDQGNLPFKPLRRRGELAREQTDAKPLRGQGLSYAASAARWMSMIEAMPLRASSSIAVSSSMR